jgi:hypothetical protein
MLVSGFFKVLKLEDGDAQGFERVALCQNLMEEGMTSRLYLPPFMRKSECAIAEGSKVWGISDTVSGLGVALYGTDCDCEYWSDADLNFKQTLTVDKSVSMNDTLTVEKATALHDKCDVTKNITSSTGNITASVGDVKATTISLKTHVHAVPTTAIPTAMPNNPAIPAVFPGATTTTPT